jgi:hypothetical protein
LSAQSTAGQCGTFVQLFGKSASTAATDARLIAIEHPHGDELQQPAACGQWITHSPSLVHAPGSPAACGAGAGAAADDASVVAGRAAGADDATDDAGAADDAGGGAGTGAGAAEDTAADDGAADDVGDAAWCGEEDEQDTTNNDTTSQRARPTKRVDIQGPLPRTKTVVDLEAYVNDNHLFGRRGWTGLEWHCSHLLAGVDPRGGNTLEIGAGEGVLGLWLLARGARSVTLLEPEAAGATAGVSVKTRALDGPLDLEPGRWIFRAEPFQTFDADRRYRLVLSHNSINHLDEEACVRLLEEPESRERYRRIFQKISEVLEPGGQLVLADCARTNYGAILLGGKTPFAPQIEWHKHHEPETWAELLEEAGLAVEEIKWWTPYYRVRVLHPLLRWRPAQCAVMSYFVLRARLRG